jgi:DNA-directed RNA polymerase I, II, and III subunit RPABC3
MVRVLGVRSGEVGILRASFSFASATLSHACQAPSRTRRIYRLRATFFQTTTLHNNLQLVIATMADATLFDDTFTLTSLNNQKYDRVSRVTGTSTDSSTILSLDINHEIYPVAVGETLQVVLASTLNLDGTKEDVSKGWREKGSDENSLADMFDYVCWGKVYRFEEGEGENM